MEIVFANQELKRAYNVAKSRNYKCYAFQKNRNISQFFFENESGKIGTAHEHFGGITLGTVHKPNRNCGTGFRITDKNSDFASPENIDSAFILAPYWASRTDVAAVKKYKNWQEYASKETILNYFEI